MSSANRTAQIAMQVKIRGYQFDIREVEVAIATHPKVLANVVRPRKNLIGQTQLTCILVIRSGDVIDVSQVRTFLEKIIPNYMIPSLFHPIDALPLTSDDQIDEAALAQLIGSLAVDRSQASSAQGSTHDHALREIRQTIADSLSAANVYMFARLGLREGFLSGADPVSTVQLEMDSLATTELCMELEIRCEVSITPEEMVTFETLDALVTRMMELLR